MVIVGIVFLHESFWFDVLISEFAVTLVGVVFDVMMIGG
jgi:hypothetical protein